MCHQIQRRPRSKRTTHQSQHPAQHPPVLRETDCPSMKRTTMRILRIAVAAALAAGTVVGGLALSAAPASADVPASNPIQYVSQYFWSGGFPASGTVSC